MENTPEDSKRKRNSSASSDSSKLSWKRIKAAFSLDSSSEPTSDNSVLESISEDTSISHTGETLPATPGPVDNSSSPIPIGHSTPMAKNNMDMDNMLKALEKMLDEKLEKQKAEFVKEVSIKYDKEINELKGRVFELEQNNDELKQRVEHLEKERKLEKDNVMAAKTHAIENDQYARRNNMLVFGIDEKVQEPAATVREIIKDKLNITLKPDDIEICHRMGRKTLNKNRPLIIRFRFRDVKWDVMSCRKSLKGSGISFSEDMCKELQELQKAVAAHPNVRSTWSWNGKIFAKDDKDNIRTIRYGRNWQGYFGATTNTDEGAENNEEMTSDGEGE